MAPSPRYQNRARAKARAVTRPHAIQSQTFLFSGALLLTLALLLGGGLISP